MFNKIVNVHSHTSAPYPQHIHEHRAATDESVRLLHEMEEKAVDNIRERFIFEDNLVKGSVVTYNDPTTWRLKGMVAFSINGKAYTEDLELGQSIFWKLDRESAYRELANKLAKQIAVMLLYDAHKDGKLTGMEHHEYKTAGQVAGTEQVHQSSPA